MAVASSGPYANDFHFGAPCFLICGTLEEHLLTYLHITTSTSHPLTFYSPYALPDAQRTMSKH